MVEFLEIQCGDDLLLGLAAQFCDCGQNQLVFLSLLKLVQDPIMRHGLRLTCGRQFVGLAKDFHRLAQTRGLVEDITRAPCAANFVQQDFARPGFKGDITRVNLAVDNLTGLLRKVGRPIQLATFLAQKFGRLPQQLVFQILPGLVIVRLQPWNQSVSLMMKPDDAVDVTCEHRAGEAATGRKTEQTIETPAGLIMPDRAGDGGHMPLEIAMPAQVKILCEENRSPLAQLIESFESIGRHKAFGWDRSGAYWMAKNFCSAK